jgi:hypothetical protein
MENSLFKQPVIDFIQKGQAVIYRKAFLLSLLSTNCWLGIHQEAFGADDPMELVQNPELAEALYKEVMNKHVDGEALKEFDKKVRELQAEMAQGLALEDKAPELEALKEENVKFYTHFYMVYKVACSEKKILPMEPTVVSEHGNLIVLSEEMRIHIAKYLDFDSLQNLMCASSSFYALGKDPQVQNALQTRDPKWLLHQVGRLEPTQLYTTVSLEEIKASAQENREPGYLPMIHQAYGIQLREFLRGKAVGESRDERMRHGLNLIILFEANHSIARCSARDAAWYAARDAGTAAAFSAAWNALFGTTSAARDDLWGATSDVGWKAAVSAANEISSEDARYGGEKAARSAAMDILSSTPNLSHIERGKLAYRVSEVTTLLYLLKFALDDSCFKIQGLFSRIYPASDEILKRDGLPDISIWESQEAWEAFSSTCFGNLTQESLAFLTPFLNEINKIRLSLNPQS